MEYGSNIRKPAVAGSFYPADNPGLTLMLQTFFKKTKRIVSNKEKIKAIMVPHAGYIYSGQTAAWGYGQLAKEFNNPDFILIGPSHQAFFPGLAADFLDFWETPLGRIKQEATVDPSINIFSDKRPHLVEHCLEVQLPFIQFLYGNKINHIGAYLTGYQLEHNKTADFFLKHYFKSLFIISSDLSHYLPQNEASLKDKKTIRAILNLDQNYFAKQENTACGQEGILVLLAMAKRKKWQRRLVFYDTSGRVSGDQSAVVGYCSIIFYEI